MIFSTLVIEIMMVSNHELWRFAEIRRKTAVSFTKLIYTSDTPFWNMGVQK